MRVLLLLACLLLALPLYAQTTAPDAYRVVSGEAYVQLGRTLLGPNFGRGRAFPVTRTFRVSSATKKDVDGMVKTVVEKITIPANTPEAQMAAAWRAKLPGLVTKLAAKVTPYTAVGSLPNTSQKHTDLTTQTPDSLVFEAVQGFTVRTRYTRGTWTGDHNLYVDVLVGN